MNQAIQIRHKNKRDTRPNSIKPQFLVNSLTKCLRIRIPHYDDDDDDVDDDENDDCGDDTFQCTRTLIMINAM
ncbi:hypothetical protein ACLKA6_003241 [Drosophila palustris]